MAKDIPKNYVGNGWEVPLHRTNSTMINISLDKDKLGMINANEHGEIKLTVCKRQTPDPKSGATHYVKQDTFGIDF